MEIAQPLAAAVATVSGTKENNGAAKLSIMPNDEMKCVKSVHSVRILNYQTHIQKNFMDFVLYVQVCPL